MSASVRAWALLPDWEPCASSTRIAKRRPDWPDTSRRWSVPNFWIVVMMMRAPPSIASRSWREVPSIFWTTPWVCSNWDTVSCSWRSSTTRSVTMIAVSKTGWSRPSCRLIAWCAVQPIVLDLPEPAECWIR